MDTHNTDARLSGEVDERIAALQAAQNELERLLAERTSALELTRRELEERTAALIRIEREYARASSRLETLIQNLPGAVYRCANDASWTMEFISDQIADISGYPAADFQYNTVRTFTSIIHPDDVFLVMAAVNKGLGRHRPYVMEYRIVHANGTVRWVSERGQGHFASDGALLWLDGVIMDITDRVPAAS